MKTWRESSRVTGAILLVASLIGLLASFALLHETFAVLKNPTYNPSCNISPIVSCSSVMLEPESEILGLPFAAFGAAGFGALLAFSVLVLAGTKFREWIWWGGIAAAGAGLLGTLYLYLLSLFNFGTVCPWCFTTWITTIAVFWALVTHVLAAKRITVNRRYKKLASWWVTYAPMILAAWYVLLLFSIFVRFKDALL